MYAIVEIAGQQFKVEKDRKVFVHRLEGNEGESVEFDRVLLIENDKQVIVGEPLIEGAMVAGKILSHPKGEKVIVFKKKRRKGYKVKNGHRQAFTELLIENIIEKGYVRKEKPATAAAKPKAETTAKAPAKEAVKAEKKKEAPKATASAPAEKKKASAPKATAEKATAEKKPATRKPAAKKPAAKTTTEKKPAAKKPAARKTDKKEE